MNSTRSGFTLIELLILTVAFGEAGTHGGIYHGTTAPVSPARAISTVQCTG